MQITEKDVLTVLKRQIALSRQALADQGYDEAFVRARIAHLAYHRGGPALDIGTGACGCMAVALARRGLRVDAVDHTFSAVRMARKRALGKQPDSFAVYQANASHLPFPDGSYRVAVAFDMLCHAADPDGVLKEMFRVSSGVVMVSELNSAGCQITHHPDKGFDRRLPDLFASYCQDCQRFDDAHHVTYLCGT